jgi:hypothetical protein
MYDYLTVILAKVLTVIHELLSVLYLTAVSTSHMRGPHPGAATFAVDDWWLEMTGKVLGVVAAAARPTTTIDRAKMRMTNFIGSTLPSGSVDEEIPHPSPLTIGCWIDVSQVFSIS